MQVRLVRVAAASVVELAVLFLATEVFTKGIHHWRLWRANGVYCFPLNEADGNYFLYGDDCPEPIELIGAV